MNLLHYIHSTLAGKSGMQIPVHNKVQFIYFEGLALTKVIRFFLNETEVAHMLYFYQGGTPTTNSAVLEQQILNLGPYNE